MENKAKSYLGQARNAGYLIIGSDKLDGYDKKLFLILIDKNAGKSSNKIALRHKENGVEVVFVDNLEELSSIKNCKILGIKNKGLSEEIKKNLVKEN